MKYLSNDWVQIGIIIVLVFVGSFLQGCQSDGKLEWSHKVLRKGESTEARNTGNCQKVIIWGNNK